MLHRRFKRITVRSFAKALKLIVRSIAKYYVFTLIFI